MSRKISRKQEFSEIRSEMSRSMAEHEDELIMSASKKEVPLPVLLTQDADVAVLLHLLFDATKAQRIAVNRDGETYWLRVKKTWDDGWQLQIGKTEEQSGVRRPIEVAAHGPDHEIWPDDDLPEQALHVSFTEDNHD